MPHNPGDHLPQTVHGLPELPEGTGQEISLNAGERFLIAGDAELQAGGLSNELRHLPLNEADGDISLRGAIEVGGKAYLLVAQTPREDAPENAGSGTYRTGSDGTRTKVSGSKYYLVDLAALGERHQDDPNTPSRALRRLSASYSTDIDATTGELHSLDDNKHREGVVKLMVVGDGQVQVSNRSERTVGGVTAAEQVEAGQVAAAHNLVRQTVQSVIEAEAHDIQESTPQQVFESPDAFERALEDGKVGGKLRRLQEAWTRAHDAMKGNILWGEEARPKLDALRDVIPELKSRTYHLTGLLQETRGLLTNTLWHAINDGDADRTASLVARVTDNLDNAHQQVGLIQNSDLDAIRPGLTPLAEDWDAAYSKALGREAGGELTEPEREAMVQECHQWAEEGMSLDQIVDKQVARADAVSARWRKRQELLDEIRMITHRINDDADYLSMGALSYNWQELRSHITGSYGEPKMATDFADSLPMQTLLETLHELHAFAEHAEEQLGDSAR